MEFVLESLGESAKYKLQYGTYSLYCVLLATRADDNIFPGILPLFHELHEVTGNHVLLLAPAVKIGHKDNPSLTDYWRWFRDGILPECSFDPLTVRAQLNEFFERQTMESYSFVRDLGMSTNDIPCLVFFESMHLKNSHLVNDAHFVWRLRSLSPQEIVKTFRSIVPMVQQTAQLELRTQLGELKSQAQTSRNFELSWRISELEREVRHLETAHDPESIFNSKETAARELQAAFEAIKDDETIRFPRPHIGATIAKLRGVAVDEADIADHLEKHLGRWRERFPQRYLDAIVGYLNALKKAREAVATSKMYSTYSATDIQRLLNNRRTSLDAKRRELALSAQESEARRQRVARLSNQLKDVPGPLEVLRSLPRSTFEHQTTQQKKFLAGSSPDILLVTVNEHETRAVHDEFESATGIRMLTVPIDGRVYRNLGSINGTTVYHALSEMGSGSVGAMQQTVDKAIRALDPGAVIAIGVAFGVNEIKQSIGDILISKQLRPYDLQRVGREIIVRGDKPHAAPRLINHFEGFAQTKWKGADVRSGVILTGEKLIDDVDYRDALLAIEGEAVGGEMEGAGLYVACNEHKVDWILLKAICDWADGNKSKNKSANQTIAAKNAVQFLIQALQYAPLNRQR